MKLVVSHCIWVAIAQRLGCQGGVQFAWNIPNILRKIYKNVIKLLYLNYIMQKFRFAMILPIF